MAQPPKASISALLDSQGAPLFTRSPNAGELLTSLGWNEFNAGRHIRVVVQSENGERKKGKRNATLFLWQTATINSAWNVSTQNRSMRTEFVIIVSTWGRRHTAIQNTEFVNAAGSLRLGVENKMARLAGGPLFHNRVSPR